MTALDVAHGMSRAEIDRRHQGRASKVSVRLMDNDELEALFGKYLTVTANISDDAMHQLTGRKE